jgi:hypothetical protein
MQTSCEHHANIRVVSDLPSDEALCTTTATVSSTTTTMTKYVPQSCNGKPESTFCKEYNPSQCDDPDDGPMYVNIS